MGMLASVAETEPGDRYVWMILGAVTFAVILALAVSRHLEKRSAHQPAHRRHED